MISNKKDTLEILIFFIVFVTLIGKQLMGDERDFSAGDDYLVLMSSPVVLSTIMCKLGILLLLVLPIVFAIDYENETGEFS